MFSLELKAAPPDTCFGCPLRTGLETQCSLPFLSRVGVRAGQATPELGCSGGAGGARSAPVTLRTALPDVEGFGRPRCVHHPGRRGR